MTSPEMSVSIILCSTDEVNAIDSLSTLRYLLLRPTTTSSVSRTSLQHRWRLPVVSLAEQRNASASPSQINLQSVALTLANSLGFAQDKVHLHADFEAGKEHLETYFLIQLLEFGKASEPPNHEWCSLSSALDKVHIKSLMKVLRRADAHISQQEQLNTTNDIAEITNKLTAFLSMTGNHNQQTPSHHHTYASPSDYNQSSPSPSTNQLNFRSSHTEFRRHSTVPSTSLKINLPLPQSTYSPVMYIENAGPILTGNVSISSGQIKPIPVPLNLSKSKSRGPLSAPVGQTPETHRQALGSLTHTIQLYKTRLCERFETEGICPYNDRCTFAHGIDELRNRMNESVQSMTSPHLHGISPDTKGASFSSHISQPLSNQNTSLPLKGNGESNPLYKTKLCEQFMLHEFCQYGPQCHFAHGQEELLRKPRHTYCDYNNRIQENDSIGSQDNRSDVKGSSAARRRRSLPVSAITPLPRLTASIRKSISNSMSPPSVGIFRRNTLGVSSFIKQDRTMLNDATASSSPTLLTSVNEHDVLEANLVDHSNEMRNLESHMSLTFPSAHIERMVGLITAFITNSQPSVDLATSITTLTPYDTCWEAFESGMRELATVHELSITDMSDLLAEAIMYGENWNTTFASSFNLLQEFVKRSADATEKMQTQDRLLYSFARYIVAHEDSLSTRTMYVFKSLYDHDIVSANAFLQWIEKIRTFCKISEKTKGIETPYRILRQMVTRLNDLAFWLEIVVATEEER